MKTNRGTQAVPAEAESYYGCDKADEWITLRKVNDCDLITSTTMQCEQMRVFLIKVNGLAL
jgi:hypothetical protein